MRALVAALAIMLCMSAARADNCDKSRDYILASSDLPQKPQTYRDLSKMCRDTLLLSNVKEAFVLKAGAIAAVPKIDSVSATAGTLKSVSPEDSLRMASLYPAAYLGLDDQRGRVAAGYRADLTLLRPDLSVLATWVGGEEQWYGARDLAG